MAQEDMKATRADKGTILVEKSNTWMKTSYFDEMEVVLPPVKSIKYLMLGYFLLE